MNEFNEMPLGIDLLESQVKEAKQMVEESDIKYDEVARKLAMVIRSIEISFVLLLNLLIKVEGDLQRAEERANAGENKIVDLEEELRVIGENLKALEVSMDDPEDIVQASNLHCVGR